MHYVFEKMTKHHLMFSASYIIYKISVGSVRRISRLVFLL